MTPRHVTHYLVVHCSATNPDLHIGADEIRKLHTAPKETMVSWNGGYMSGKGWDDIGYHYVIRRTGVVETGRAEQAVGAHALGYNHESLGICLVGGGGGKFDFTRQQMAALEALLNALLLKYKRAVVVGHERLDTQGKTCPNFAVAQWWYGNV